MVCWKIGFGLKFFTFVRMLITEISHDFVCEKVVANQLFFYYLYLLDPYPFFILKKGAFLKRSWGPGCWGKPFGWLQRDMGATINPPTHQPTHQSFHPITPHPKKKHLNPPGTLTHHNDMKERHTTVRQEKRSARRGRNTDSGW